MTGRAHRRVTMIGVAAGMMAVVVIPTLLIAHAVVFPRTSTPGAYERYSLRVPNEKNVATTRIELRFPKGLRVNSFADVAGWKQETVTDSAGAIVAAIW